jgi:type IV secretory pathway VirB2 component (pilin)
MNLSKFDIAVTSPAVWTLVGLFVFNGLTAIVPQLSGNVADIVNVVLVVLAGYLHTSHVQSVSSAQSLS